MRTTPITVRRKHALLPIAYRGSRCWGKIDVQDWDLVSGRTWSMTKAGYLQAKINGTPVYLHRMLMDNPRNRLVDHIDRDSLNNCRSNLRLATKKQNSENQGIREDNSTGYRGVDYHKSSDLYRARVRHHGREHHLGMYGTAEQANAAAIAERQRLGFRTSTPN